VGVAQPLLMLLVGLAQPLLLLGAAVVAQGLQVSLASLWSHLVRWTRDVPVAHAALPKVLAHGSPQLPCASPQHASPQSSPTVLQAQPSPLLQPSQRTERYQYTPYCNAIGSLLMASR
jgi:hypothetical protein